MNDVTPERPAWKSVWTGRAGGQARPGVTGGGLTAAGGTSGQDTHILQNIGLQIGSWKRIYRTREQPVGNDVKAASLLHAASGLSLAQPNLPTSWLA